MGERTFENLNKENFWNSMKSNYPTAMAHFSEWIDAYKDSIKWKTMFFKSKFHDIPFEMQLGILIQYFFERGCLDTLMIALGTENKKKAITASQFKKKLVYLFDKLEKEYE